MCGGDIEDFILFNIIAEFHHGFEAYLYQNTKIVDKGRFQKKKKKN